MNLDAEKKVERPWPEGVATGGTESRRTGQWEDAGGGVHGDQAPPPFHWKMQREALSEWWASAAVTVLPTASPWLTQARGGVSRSRDRRTSQ